MKFTVILEPFEDHHFEDSENVGLALQQIGEHVAEGWVNSKVYSDDFVAMGRWFIFPPPLEVNDEE